MVYYIITRCWIGNRLKDESLNEVVVPDVRGGTINGMRFNVKDISSCQQSDDVRHQQHQTILHMSVVV